MVRTVRLFLENIAGGDGLWKWLLPTPCQSLHTVGCEKHSSVPFRSDQSDTSDSRFYSILKWDCAQAARMLFAPYCISFD
jgi:hypothetical protein